MHRAEATIDTAKGREEGRITIFRPQLNEILQFDWSIAGLYYTYYHVRGHYAKHKVVSFAKTISIEGGAGKAELDWEELESLDTRVLQVTVLLPGNVVPRVVKKLFKGVAYL